MGDKKPAIVFEAQVAKVTTLADGGIRITLDLPETAIAQAAMLMDTKRQGLPLEFSATVGNLIKLDEQTKKGTEGKTVRVGRRRV